MRRWGWMLGLVLGCGGPDDASPDLTEPEPSPSAEPAPFGKGDDPHAHPPPAVGIACDRPRARSCDGDAPLRCVDGSGGAKWMADAPCVHPATCVEDWGCMPLATCTEVSLLSCVGQDLFACEAQDDGTRVWRHLEECPAAIPCVDGRGCPNPYGIGTECSFVEPPRCTGRGQVIACTLEGIDAVWAPPEPCPAGERCVRGHGCTGDDPDPPDERAPTSPPKGGN